MTLSPILTANQIPCGNSPNGSGGRRDDPEGQIQREMDRERVRREARRRLDAEERGPVTEPEMLNLRDWFSQPDEGIRWRIDGWQPTDSRVILAAQMKTGKTTLVGSLVRSMVDADLWLGQHKVQPITGAVAILDTEMSRAQTRQWLRDQCITNTDRVFVIPLRGRAAALDLFDREKRLRWAERLRSRGVQYVVLDCLRPVLDALGLDEHRDAGRYLVAFDALLNDAQISEACIVHHMGHAGERSRGDSRLRDWPDVEWRMLRESDDPASARYITAYGRDVNIPECRLSFDAETRQLTIAGGSRRDTKLEDPLAKVLDVLRTGGEEGMSQRAIVNACIGSEYGRPIIERAIEYGIRVETISTRKGARGAHLHRPTERVRSAQPPRNCNSARSADAVSSAQQPYRGCALHTPQSGRPDVASQVICGDPMRGGDPMQGPNRMPRVGGMSPPTR